jgi:hypothetical protein
MSLLSKQALTASPVSVGNDGRGPAPAEPLSDVFDEAKERKLLMNQ